MPSCWGAVKTMRPERSVTSMPEGADTDPCARVRGSPSGSMSLARTATDTLVPGRTLTESGIATGAWLSVGRGATPTRIPPMACFPRASSTT